MGGENTNSMCAVYAALIRTEVQSDNLDEEKVLRLLGYIEKYCQTVGFEPGETPEHLEDFLYEEGDAPSPAVD